MHHGLPLGGDEPVDAGARGGAAGAAGGAILGGAAGTVAGAIAAPLAGPARMAAGIATGALVGSIVGATTAMGQEERQKPSARPGGVMVAVNAVNSAPVDEKTVIETMRECGSKLVETADGE